MTKSEINEILDGMLKWYDNPDNVLYDNYLLSYTQISTIEWDEAKEKFTKEQQSKWHRILTHYKTRLEEMGINKEGSANFVTKKLIQEKLWKVIVEDTIEENELELILDEVSALLKKPVQKLSDNKLEIIKKNSKVIEENEV